ncbi:alpha/beta fold hydrolase [Lysobacter soli]|nr:alpha/beta fold hydrolase [Lysobacter soli]
MLPLSTSATTTYKHVTADGVGIFYREAGQSDAPTVVLLHGFPTSSRQFDALIPLLAPYYHVIAPDYPGFGRSEAPPPSSYEYTFDRLSRTIQCFLAEIGIDRCSFYLHDYGGPVGFRTFLAKPERLQALIIQNANAYDEGLGAKWAAIRDYWEAPALHTDVAEAFLSLESTQGRHTLGSAHPERYNPEIWEDESARLAQPAQRDIQSRLLYDYRTNVASYRAWQNWLRARQPPALIVWGRNDPSFVAAGAQAYLRDLPDAELHLLDAGHFALEEQLDEIALLMLSFLGKHLGTQGDPIAPKRDLLDT